MNDRRKKLPARRLGAFIGTNQVLELVGIFSAYFSCLGWTFPIEAMQKGQDPAELSKVFRKRKVFPRLQKGEVRFINEKNPSRIYFDWESKRYEIGNGLNEPEIEWLYSQLSSWSN